MLVWVLMLWFAMQLDSPTWVYVCIGTMLVLSIIESVVELIEKIMQKRLERERKKLNELKRRVGSNRE